MKRHLSADIVRTLAMFGVVAIHTANAVFARPDFIGGISWWFAEILNAVSRASIPLFVMVSGYFILGKHESAADTWKRTWKRLVVPLLFWFVLRVIWNTGNPSLSHLSWDVIQRLLTVNVMDLYFLIILIGLYAVSPVLRAYLKTQTERQLKITAATFLLFGAVFYAVEFFLGLCVPANALDFWIPYTGLFVAGYVYGRQKIGRPPRLTAVYFAALVLTIIGGYAYFVLTSQGNTLLHAGRCLNFYTDSYLSVNVTVMAVSLFLLIMHTDFSGIPVFLKSFVQSVARHSLGIYVLNAFVINVMEGKGLVDYPMPLWIYVILRWIIVFFISYAAAFALMRIPFLRFAFGIRKSTD